MFEGYINKQECLDMFNERFALMRAKYSDKLGRLKISFDYADDKRTYQLILCDYICNSHFSSTAVITICYIHGIIKGDYAVFRAVDIIDLHIWNIDSYGSFGG